MYKLKSKHDLSFLWMCLKIGIGVLIYRGGIDLLSYLIVPLVGVAGALAPENTALVNSVTYLTTSIVSVVSFLFAAVFLWISLRINKKKLYQPTWWTPRFTLTAPLLIIATIALNFAMAEINAILINLLAPGVTVNVGLVSGTGISALEVILIIISTAVIPGIVEEIMFRGILLTNLAPYGKGMAIVTSALLFGLMHMNPSQFFYTTVMGLALGVVYLKTKSIWICIIIHFTNNALGVIQQIIYQCYEMKEAERIVGVMMLVVSLLGIVSIGMLLAVGRVNDKKRPEEKGSFGRLYEPELSFESKPITKGWKPLLFFSPTVSIFTVIVFASMLLAMSSTFVVGLLLGAFPDFISF